MARILLGDSDGERLVSVLRQHYAAGRFDLDDLRRRAEIVYTAVYRDEAQGALDGLPSVAEGEPQSSQRRERREGWPRRRGHAQARRPESQLGADGRTVPRPVQRHNHAGLG